MTARAQATKRKLFTATLQLAETKGLADLTVDEIAAEAGVAKGTVYYNFGSKDGLIDGLLRYGIGMIAERLRAATGDQEPLPALESIVDAALTFIAEYPGFSQIVVSELWRTPGRWHETLAPLREDVVSILKEQLARLDEVGRLPPGIDVPAAAAGMFGTLLVMAMDWRVFQPQRTREQVRDSMMVLMRGVAGRADPQR